MTEDIAKRTMCVGFLFNGRRVLLVNKNKPDWQRGLWNGVGGVIEEEETPIAGMVREFFEETKMQTLPGDWRHFATEFEPFGAVVHFYHADMSPRANHVMPSCNDVGEALMWCHCDDIYRLKVLGNLSWLIPLARDPRRFTRPLSIEAVGDIRTVPTW